MLCKTEGIVLKQMSYSETSLIVKIYTKDFGLISLIVKGAKSASKNSKGSILRPMNQLNLTLYYREQKNLLSLKDVQLIFAPDSLMFGIQKSAVGMFITEVLIQTITEEKEKDASKYNFIIDTFEFLKQNELTNTFYLSFFLNYMNYLGIYLVPSMISQNQSIVASLERGEHIAINREQRFSIFKAIESQYLLHIPNFKSIKSIDILESVLN